MDTTNNKYYIDQYGTWCKSCGSGVVTNKSGIGFTCSSPRCSDYNAVSAPDWIKKFWDDYNSGAIIRCVSRRRYFLYTRTHQSYCVAFVPSTPI